MEGVDEGDEGAIDAGGARAAVGLEDVAIEPEGAFADLIEVDNGPQAAANEPLNLDATAIHLAGLVALFARFGAAWKLGIHGAVPAVALAFKKGGHAILDAGAAQHHRPTLAHEHTARGLTRVVAAKRQLAQFIGFAAGRARFCHDKR